MSTYRPPDGGPARVDLDLDRRERRTLERLAGRRNRAATTPPAEPVDKHEPGDSPGCSRRVDARASHDLEADG